MNESAFILDDQGNQHGPFSQAEIQQLIQDGVIRSEQVVRPNQSRESTQAAKPEASPPISSNSRNTNSAVTPWLIVGVSLLVIYIITSINNRQTVINNSSPERSQTGDSFFVKPQNPLTNSSNPTTPLSPPSNKQPQYYTLAAVHGIRIFIFSAAGKKLLVLLCALGGGIALSYKKLFTGTD